MPRRASKNKPYAPTGSNSAIVRPHSTPPVGDVNANVSARYSPPYRTPASNTVSICAPITTVRCFSALVQEDGPEGRARRCNEHPKKRGHEPRELGRRPAIPGDLGNPEPHQRQGAQQKINRLNALNHWSKSRAIG